jgi:hypothetical protein
MKKLNEKALNNAAKSHAISILGETQFKLNKDAARSIKDDFKAGALFTLNAFNSQNAEVIK